jgi:hypothetical protein
MRHRYVWSMALPLLGAGMILALICYLFQPDEPQVPPDQSKVAPVASETARGPALLRHDEDEGPLRCSLMPWPASGTMKKYHPFDLHLELSNTTDQPISFWYLTHPHFQVTFVMRDQENKVVKQFFYGSLSSTSWHWFPTGKADRVLPEHTLLPGDDYATNFKMAVLEEYLEVPGPGRYKLEAKFAADGQVGEAKQRFVAHSQPLLIEVEAAPDRPRPQWKLVFD